MANWTSSTLLSRLLELIEANTELDRGQVLADPAVIDSTFSTASRLIWFLKEQVIEEAMRGQANVHRPTKKAKPKATKAERPDKSMSDAIAATATALAGDPDDPPLA